MCQPEPVDPRRTAHRPSSPLRNGYTVDDESEDGSVHEDASVDRPWSQRSHSPSPSITKFASNIAQRVGALVGSTNSRSSNGLPTEAELEAEAERERERSRREAEVIIQREAEERRMVEEGVLAMIEGQSSTQLPPPPPRSQTMSSNPPSPSNSQKEKEGWFAAVKSKLTPSKEPLTPAQQIIMETKAKEKEKKKGKDKDKEQWPAVPSSKYSDPAFVNLVNSAPVTPPRPIGQNTLTMTPSPKQSVDSSRDAPPLYAQFNAQNSLDVSATLLTIARRFEKLERWTVSHVRALEERMGDVERWLVDKEKEKEDTPPNQGEPEVSSKSSFHSDEQDLEGRQAEMSEIRDELAELQGRVGELGREMAKLMTAPRNLTSGPERNASAAQVQAAPAVPPTPTSIAPRSLPTVPSLLSTPRPIAPVAIRPKEASSPPPIQRSESVLSAGGRTRLPYPTGDYTSPPGTIVTKQEILSPTNSPPSSLNEASRRRPISIAGLPLSDSSFFQTSQPSTGSGASGLPQRNLSPPSRALSPSSSSSRNVIATPSRHSQHNISPTPRKRYTVALGAPIVGSSTSVNSYDDQRMFSGSSVSTPDVTADEADSSDAYDEYGDAEARAIGHSRDDTIGKSEERRSETLPNPPSMPNDTLRRTNSSSSPRNSPRTRAMSSYGALSGSSALLSPSSSPSPIAPLRPRLRSKSSDKIGLGISWGSTPGKFVDPLVIRKQEKEGLLPKTPKTPTFARGQKVPIGDLVAFFDGDKH